VATSSTYCGCHIDAAARSDAVEKMHDILKKNFQL
jgi:hypothetical protein